MEVETVSELSVVLGDVPAGPPEQIRLAVETVLQKDVAYLASHNAVTLFSGRPAGVAHMFDDGVDIEDDALHHRR